MRLDSTLAFVPLGGQSLVAGAGVNIASINVIDFLGLGVGVAPTNIIGNASIFGEDLGIGDGLLVPKLMCSIGTAPTTGNAATLNVALQLSADTALTFQPALWVTAVETGAIAVANLAANTVIARFDWPPSQPVNLNPRYARLLFQVPTGTNFSAGTIAFAGITSVRDDQSNKFAAANYVVA